MYETHIHFWPFLITTLFHYVTISTLFHYSLYTVSTICNRSQCLFNIKFEQTKYMYILFIVNYLLSKFHDVLPMVNVPKLKEKKLM